jgi:hypothetical protein
MGTVRLVRQRETSPGDEVNKSEGGHSMTTVKLFPESSPVTVRLHIFVSPGLSAADPSGSLVAGSRGSAY